MKFRKRRYTNCIIIINIIIIITIIIITTTTTTTTIHYVTDTYTTRLLTTDYSLLQRLLYKSNKLYPVKLFNCISHSRTRGISPTNICNLDTLKLTRNNLYAESNLLGGQPAILHLRPVHRPVEVVEIFVLKVLVVDQVPLTTRVVIAVAVAVARKVQPFRVTKLVACTATSYM